MGRGADLNLTQVLGVVLLVLSGNLASLAVGGGPDKLLLVTDTTAPGDVGVGKATLVDCCGMLVWTGLGGLKAEAVEEVDVGLRAVRLVVLVGDGQDLLEAEFLLKLGLGLECGRHGWFFGSQGADVFVDCVVMVLRAVIVCQQCKMNNREVRGSCVIKLGDARFNEGRKEALLYISLARCRGSHTLRGCLLWGCKWLLSRYLYLGQQRSCYDACRPSFLDMDAVVSHMCTILMRQQSHLKSRYYTRSGDYLGTRLTEQALLGQVAWRQTTEAVTVLCDGGGTYEGRA